MLQDPETIAQAGQKLRLLSAPVNAVQKSLLRPKILLVDDVAVVRHVLRRSLECLSFDVIEAAGGREAIAIYRQEGHAIAGVLLDMSMPDLDGLSTFRVLKAIDSDVNVVLVSGSFTECSWPPLGARACLPKPCSLSLLKECFQGL